MKQSELLQLYKVVVEQTGFKEDMNNPGWMPKLGPNDYRSILRHGTHNGKPAMLKVSPQENLVKIAQDFIKYQKETSGKPVICVPNILENGKIPGAEFLIQESSPQGVRIIKNWPLATPAEKEEVARLYWETISNFPDYDLAGEWTISDYFVMRLDKSLAAGRDYGVQTKGFISAREKDNIIKFIFINAQKLAIQPFFDHFSNTDIVKANNEYYIWESSIAPKPEAAGIALWLWGATMYAHDIPTDQWQDEMKSWISTFKKFAPTELQADLELKININLSERFLSTLLLDLPLKRSPFDKLSDAEVMKARVLFRELLKDIGDFIHD